MRDLHVLKFRLRRADKTARPTFFFHIPKCAGTSVWDSLLDVYGTRHVFLVNSKRKRKKLAAMHPDARRSYGAIGGHGPLSFFRDLLGDMERHYKIVTLRDPVERAISEYNYICARPKHPLYSRLAGMSFEDYARDERGSNRQVLLLTGRRDDVKTAIYLVQNFFDDWAFIDGVDALIDRIYRVTGTKPRPTQHKNESGQGLKRTDIDPATLRLLEEQNQYDTALVEALKRMRPQ